MLHGSLKHQADNATKTDAKADTKAEPTKKPPIEHRVSVFQDCTVHFDLNKGKAYQLFPKPLNAKTNVYGETQHSWMENIGMYKANTELSLEVNKDKPIELVSTGLKTCHTVIIKKVNEPIFWVMHVSPESSRRQYDPKTKTAIDDLDLAPVSSEEMAFAAGITPGMGRFGDLGGFAHLNSNPHARTQQILDNKAKPAYIDADQAFYPALPGVGITKNDEVDVCVVHTGIGFIQDHLVERLNEFCKIRSLQVVERDRSKLVKNADPNENYFYEVALQLNPAKPIDSTLVIRSDGNDFYREEIANPFSTVKPIAVVAPAAPKTYAKIDLTPNFEDGTLGYYLVEYYGSIPIALINSDELNTPLDAYKNDLFCDMLKAHLNACKVNDKTLGMILAVFARHECRERGLDFPLANAFGDLVYLCPLDLNAMGYFVKEKGYRDVLYNTFMEGSKPISETDILPANAQSLSFREKIIVALEKCVPLSTINTNSFSFFASNKTHAQTVHAIFAKEYLNFLKKQPNLEPVQIKNWLYAKLYHLISEASFARTSARMGNQGEGFTFKQTDPLSQALLLGISLCDKEIPQAVKAVSVVQKKKAVEVNEPARETMLRRCQMK